MEQTIPLEFFIPKRRPQRLGKKWIFFRLRTMILQKQVIDPSKHRTTQHGGREGEQE